MKNFTLSTVFFFLFTFLISAQESYLIITEVMNNPLTESKGEWVEIYNKGLLPIDLMGYVIDDNSGSDINSANIPGFILLPNTSVVLYDIDILEGQFELDWGTVDAIAVDNWPSLNNSGDSIGIWSSYADYVGDNENQLNVISQLIYESGSGWPSTSNGKSIYLNDLLADSTMGVNWSLSSTNVGEDETPLFNSYESLQGDIGSPGSPNSDDDSEAPEIVCPDDVTVTTEENSCSALFPIVNPTATDLITANEDIVYHAVRSDGLDMLDSFNSGVTTITWTAEDLAGNISEPCEQIITVNDEEAPEINCAADVVVTATESITITITLPDVTDNCSAPVTLTSERSDDNSLILEDEFPVGSTTITWTALDASNNSSTCTQIVTISTPTSDANDITAVSLLNQIGDAEIYAEEKSIEITMPYGTDLTLLSPEFTISDGASVSPESGSVQDFSDAVTYKVIAANESEQEWIISVIVLDDIELPTIECPENIIVANDVGECGAVVEFEVSATDNSGAVTVTSDYDSESVFPIGETIVTATATDEAGNEATCSFTVTVEDNEEPILVCAANIEETANEGESISLIIEAPEYTDNCGLQPNLMGVRDDNLEMSDPFSIGTTIITWSISDLTGNVGTCSQTVTVNSEVLTDLSITSFTLVNADTNEDLYELADGMQIDYSKLPTLNLDIRANTSEAVESVFLEINSSGNVQELENSRTESLMPFAFFQDLPIGDYKGATFFDGFFTISAIPYSLDNRKGEEGISSSLTFDIAGYCQEATDRSYVDTFPADCDGIGGRAVLGTTLKISDADAPFWEIDPEHGDYVRSHEPGSYTVTVGEEPGCTTTIAYTIEGCPAEALSVTSFTLIDADNDVPIFDLTEGQQININSLPTTHLDIRANTTDDVESVRFSITGALENERTESLLPYALFQDLPIGDYIGADFVVGMYTLQAKPYSGNSLKGNLGQELTLNFELVDGDPACSSLMADVVVENPTICGAGGNITITPSGGTAPYEVGWNSVSYVGETITGLSAGTYSASVTDANGCSIRVVAEIEDPALPEVTLDPFSNVFVSDVAFALSGAMPTGGIYSGDGVTGGMFDPAIGEGTYEITYTYVDEVTECSNSAVQEITVMMETANNIIQYWLVNADNEMDLFPITEGMQIDISTLPTQNLDIKAETGTATESVGFELSGTQSIMRGESVPPYALFQDLPIGDYIGHNFELGAYTLDGIPYAQNNLTGDAGENLTINFEFIDTTPMLAVTGFTLIDAADESEHFELIDGMEITLSQIESLFLDIRANTTDDVESVRLELSGEQRTARTESLEPYALFQDLPIGDYKGNNFEFGEYTVTATPYSGNNLSGEMGTPLAISFSIVEDIVAASLKINPNNVATLATASFSTPIEIEQILIFDMSGRLIESYNPDYIKSGDDYILDVNYYQQGTYIVKAVDKRGVPYQKQMVVKRE
ncbi:HYR domain-containing protein [Aurantibacter sp.]|uniref:HYR domain-containing protein n=1 Tax=Aurantibacter sp. TaxID=2807103 RepID=UPI0032667679